MTNPFETIPLTGWYPGHMLKAGRQIQEQLRLVDLVVELLDARIPQTSRNPAFDRLLGNKPRCLILTKRDLAADPATRAWIECFKQNENTTALALDSRNGREVGRLLPLFQRLVKTEARTGLAKRALRPPRIMIVGIPNVGKSTLLNRLAAGKKAQVGPRPGVTRSQQWVTLRDRLELLDTPGVLWPRIQDKTTELKLGLAGTIKDELIGEELLAEYLLWWNRNHRSPLSFSSYGIESPGRDAEAMLEQIARRRGLLQGGGEIDRGRAASALLHDFRAGKLGRTTLDGLPNQENRLY